MHQMDANYFMFISPDLAKFTKESFLKLITVDKSVLDKDRVNDHPVTCPHTFLFTWNPSHCKRDPMSIVEIYDSCHR